MFKVNNTNTRTRWIMLKLTIKTPERSFWCLYCYTSHFALVFLLLTLNMLLFTGNAESSLTYFSPVSLLFRNKSIDLYCKSMEKFLHNGNTGLKWFNQYWTNVLFLEPWNHQKVYWICDNLVWSKNKPSVQNKQRKLLFSKVLFIVILKSHIFVDFAFVISFICILFRWILPPKALQCTWSYNFFNTFSYTIVNLPCALLVGSKSKHSEKAFFIYLIISHEKITSSKLSIETIE